MDNITCFDFNGAEIRTQLINGKLWFVAKDICSVLELINVSKACDSLDDDEKDAITISDSVGKLQEMLHVNESGLYCLLFKSRKPQAKQFKRWVTHEVLPSIRQTGSYSTNKAPKLPSRQLALETAHAVDEITELLNDRNPRLAQILVDHAISDIISAQPKPNKQLPNTSPSGKVLKGVVEIALDLGYQTDHSNRGKLGKFVKDCMVNVDPNRIYHEERLVNGLMLEVCCYEQDDLDVEQAIIAFFER